MSHRQRRIELMKMLNHQRPQSVYNAFKAAPNLLNCALKNFKQVRGRNDILYLLHKTLMNPITLLTSDLVDLKTLFQYNATQRYRQNTGDDIV